MTKAKKKLYKAVLLSLLSLFNQENQYYKFDPRITTSWIELKPYFLKF